MAKLQLKDIPLAKLPAMQSIALSRLTLLTMAHVHTEILGFQKYLLELVNKHVDSEGFADVSHIIQSWGAVSEAYRKVFDRYTKLLSASRQQAASLPFGVLVAQHNAYVGQQSLTEALQTDQTAVIVKLWQQRKERALQAIQQRVGGDSLVLSHRIWRLQADGLSNIRATLADAFTNRTSATKLAKQLESQLGANASMPRWAASRLYGLTAKERMVSAKGLFSGPQAVSTGIAYAAIRLARTELQFANHAVATEVASHAPWVVGRKVALSPAHPKSDICDKWAADGPYPKDQEILPLHPNCICYYINVLSTKTDFAKDVKGWLDGDNGYLDDYSDWLGTTQVTETLPWDLSIADTMELWLNASAGAQALALQLPEPEPLAIPAPVSAGPKEFPVQKPVTPIAVTVAKITEAYKSLDVQEWYTR